MDKIYSRRRFLIKSKNRKKNNLPHLVFIRKKLIKIIIILIIGLGIYKLILSYLEPVFEALCEEKTKSIATIIANEQSSKVMEKYQYEELFTVEKDENGNIKIIKSNVICMNNLISDLTGNIQKEFDALEKTRINIPMGSLTGKYFLSGMGPDIPVHVRLIGNIDTDVKSEFSAQGINQTLHRVYLNLECKMKILTPIRNYDGDIINQVMIAEHVIVGDIPETYYNLEGMEQKLDSMEVIN